MPDKVSDEKIKALRSFGAKVITTPTAVAPEDPRSYYSVADRIARETPNCLHTNQYHNQSNPETHYRTTGPEIWQQTDGEIDYFFAGIGTGGTIAGVGKYLKEQNPDVKIVAVEPASRHHQLSGLKRVTGLPDEHFPTILDRGLIDEFVSVSDDDAYTAGIEVARKEGIMVGPTTGALLHAALHTNTDRRGRAVLISGDSAAKYVSSYAEYL